MEVVRTILVKQKSLVVSQAVGAFTLLLRSRPVMEHVQCTRRVSYVYWMLAKAISQKLNEKGTLWQK